MLMKYHRKKVEQAIKENDFPEINKLLLRVASAGDMEAVQQLIAAGADLHGDDYQHPVNTPIHLAADKNRLEVVRLLLEAGVDPNIRSAINSSTPLHQAAYSAGPEMVRLLIEHGADPNLSNKDGKTPVYLTGNIRALAVLVEHGAKINVQDAQGQTPLHAARTPQIAQQLVEYGADVDLADHEGKSPLDLAVEQNRVPFVEVLAPHSAQGVSVDPVVINAIAYRQARQLQGLLAMAGGLKSLYNWEGQQLTPVQVAISTKPTTGYISEKWLLQTIRLLLEHGANPGDHPAGTLSPLAMIADRRWRYQFLYRKSPGYLDVIELLLKNGAVAEDLLLYQAIFYQDDELAKVLQRYKASLNAAVSFAGRTETSRQLQQRRKQRVNRQDEYGRTPLHWAAVGGVVDQSSGEVPGIRKLLDDGADPEIFDQHGHTALHYAVKGGHFEAAHLLLEHGVRLFYTWPYGVSALDQAVAYRHERCVGLLRQFGDRQNKPLNLPKLAFTVPCPRCGEYTVYMADTWMTRRDPERYTFDECTNCKAQFERSGDSAPLDIAPRYLKSRNVYGVRGFRYQGNGTWKFVVSK